MSDWMKDFDRAKARETRKKPTLGQCKSCRKIKKLGDDGKCPTCFVKGDDDE